MSCEIRRDIIRREQHRVVKGERSETHRTCNRHENNCNAYDDGAIAPIENQLFGDLAETKWKNTKFTSHHEEKSNRHDDRGDGERGVEHVTLGNDDELTENNKNPQNKDAQNIRSEHVLVELAEAAFLKRLLEFQCPRIEILFAHLFVGVNLYALVNSLGCRLIRHHRQRVRFLSNFRQVGRNELVFQLCELK